MSMAILPVDGAPYFGAAKNVPTPALHQLRYALVHTGDKPGFRLRDPLTEK